MTRIIPSAREARAVLVADQPHTYAGGFGSTGASPEAALRRLVGAHLLFENQFYRSGADAGRDLLAAAAQVPAPVVAQIAREAVQQWKLRHVPLFLAAHLATRHDAHGLVRPLVKDVVTRADMLAELPVLYARLHQPPVELSKLKHALPMGLKHGLADVFGTFDRYQLAKYDRAQAIRLRDVLFLVHPKPIGDEQAETWKLLASGVLPAPDTWEVALSGGADKRETFERLLRDKKLGDLALLRNLRGMLAAGVSLGEAIGGRRFARVLPFQFIAAMHEAPRLEAALDAAMLRGVAEEPRLPGSTLIVVDVSGSMRGPLGGRSKLNRLDAACGLAILLRQVSDTPTIYATAGRDALERHATAPVPARQGMALRDALVRAMGQLGGGGIFLTQSLAWIREHGGGDGRMYDRVVVITDEQDCDRNSERAPDRAPKLGQRNYLFNVGAYDVGLGVKAYWETISGFSEAAVRYVAYAEQQGN